MGNYEHSDPEIRFKRRLVKNLIDQRKDLINSITPRDKEVMLKNITKSILNDNKIDVTYSLYWEDNGFNLENSLDEPVLKLEESKSYSTHYIHPKFDIIIELKWKIENNLPKVYYYIEGNYIDAKLTYSKGKRFEGNFKWNDSYLLTIGIPENKIIIEIHIKDFRN